MIKVILFDADRVLINGQTFKNVLTQELHIPPEKTLPFFKGPFQDCLEGKADLKETITPYLRDWGWDKSVDAFLELWFKREHSVDEELVSYIQALRKQGIICVVATNQEKYRLEYMLSHMGFADSFDKVYGSAHLGYQKPNHKFYESIVEDLGITNKQEVILWDDSKDKVQGAKEYGILAETYTNFAEFKEKMKKYL